MKIERCFVRGVKLRLASALVLACWPSFAVAQNFVYVNNDSSPNSVSAFALDGSGHLTAVPGSPFATGGNGSDGGFFAASRIVVVNDFLYATNSTSGSISGFSINSGTGALTPVPGSPFSTALFGPDTMAAIGSSSLLLASDGSGIQAFSFDAAGSLTSLYTINATPPIDGVAISSNGKFFAAANLSAMEMYTIGPDRTLTPVPGSPFAQTGQTGGQLTSAAFTCDSTRLYGGEANFGRIIVDAWTVDSAGVLTPITGSPFTQGEGSDNSNVAIIDPASKFVFVANQGSDTTPVFSINADGSLTPVPGSPFATRRASGLVITSDGKFLGGAFFGFANSYSVAANGAVALVMHTAIPGSGALSVATYPNPSDSCGGPADTAPPTSSGQLSPLPNANGWNNSNVTVTISATDNTGGSGVQSITYSAMGAQPIVSTTVNGASTNIVISTEGTTTISFHATDNAGNAESPEHTVTVKLDKTNPTVNCASPDGLWHATDVSLACSASDPLSGLAVAGDASFLLSTSVAANTETNNASTSTHVVCDLADNCATAGPISGNMVDKKLPSSSGQPSPLPNLSGWNNSNVTVTLSAADGGSGVKSIIYSATGAQPVARTTFNGASTSILISTEGTTTISFHATDNAGNVESTEHTLTVKLDKANPSVNCASPDGLWHATDVSLACTAGDALSGLAVAGDASFLLSTSVAANTETNNASTSSHVVCDVASNCFTAGPISGNMVDKKPPSVTITAPANTGSYLLNAGVASNYQCLDAGSGVQSCTGPVANGANFNTSSAGPKTFTVNGKDNVNNASSASNSYSVLYASGGACYGDAGHQILQPINADGSSVWKQGSTVPAKFRVCDANGVSIGTPGVVSAFNLVNISAGTTTVMDETVVSTTPDTAFRWDSTGQQWIFNISTTALSADQTYVYQIQLNDGSSIFFQFGLR
jgi:hypothetical protein